MSCPNKFLLKYSVDNVLCVGLAFLNTLYRPKTFIFNDTAQILIQGVFFNWPHPEFAKCWPVSN